MRAPWISRAAVAVALLGIALPSAAQQDAVADRFRLNLGGFFQTFDTTVGLTRPDGTGGGEVDLQDVLGTDSRQTNLRADGYWRFGPHGSLQFAYRGWNLRNSRTIDRDFTFGDKTYHAGADVDSQLRVSVADLYYGYSFVHNSYGELGLGLGLSAYFTKVSISANGTITGPGGTASGSFDETQRSLVAPLPALLVFFRYSLYPTLFVYGRAKGITGTIDGYHGEMFDGIAGLEYFFTRNVGLGAGYEYVDIKFSHTGDQAELSFRYKYNGPLAYLSLSF